MQNMQYEKTYSTVERLKQIGNIKISNCRTFHKLNDYPLYSTRFNDVEKFHYPGLAPVYDKSGGYHINFDGIAVYSQRFDYSFGFYCNRAAVIDQSKYYHINSQGDRAYQGHYDWVGNYQENKCLVRKQNMFCHIDIEGNKIYSEEYDYVGDFQDDVAVVYKNQQASHINDKGDFIHNKWYKKLGVFHKKYANAEDDKGWFHINIKGEAIYDYRYKMVEPFYNGQAKVETFSGMLGQININGEIKHIIYQPSTISQMHQISGEMVGFWRTYLINAASQLGILQLLPSNVTPLAKKLKVKTNHLHRFLRALWEISLINYCKEQDIWELTEKGKFLIDHPFMIQASKMWGRVIVEKNWLKIPELLKKTEMKSFLSFKENEKDHNIQTELYQALIGYTSLDTVKFAEQINIDQNSKILLFGVHSLALVDILKSKNINYISYYNDPELPKQLTQDFNIDIRKKNDVIKEYDIVIFGRFLQHQDDHKVLSHFKALKNSNVSRILLIETIVEEHGSRGGVIDINIMVETGGKLRTKKNWEDILKQVGNLSISKISSLTNYLSVIDIRRK